MKVRSLSLVAVVLAAGVSLIPATSPVTADEPSPAVGRPAPSFSADDVEGKKRSLSEFRGRRVALFFYCGCSWCSDAAKEWGPLQHGGALEEKAVKAPITVIVYQGSSEPLRALAAYAGLDPAQTVLLPDPKMTVTKVYDADPCPRVFVLDAGGVIRYTNNGKDDAPREAPAQAIVSRTVDALRASGPSPADKPGPEGARK